YSNEISSLFSVEKYLSIQNACEKAIQLAIDYFSKLIKIIPRSESDMRYKTKYGYCGGVEVPQNDRVIGKKSDLHIYVQFKNESTLTYIANAGWCQFLNGLGPTHGEVNFNISSLKFTNWDNHSEFKDLLQTVIHEITHILGFTYSDIPKWITSNKNHHNEPTIQQKLRGIDTIFLKTPHVLTFARKYFNCPTLVGMPLENIGGEGSKNSHWKSTIIQNEYMNPSVSYTQAYFSGFTANLLRDTGFYYEIKESMVEKISYGQGAGCQHVTGVCDSAKREYCNPQNDQGLCDYYHLGSSDCRSGQFDEPTCYTQYVNGDSQCWEIRSNRNTKQNQDIMGVKFGVNSRCFNSSIYKDKQQPPKTRITGECYQYECKTNGQLNVYVGKTKVVCTNNLQNLQVNGYQGYLTCPENIQKFCGFKKFCPNYCSSNGYCLNNECHCAKQNFGNDCSKKNPFKN
ncbi:leishmanolysin family protein, putative, partial [Ichthyophthirius multifiliis]